jgi:hypothetical protein
MENGGLRGHSMQPRQYMKMISTTMLSLYVKTYKRSPYKGDPNSYPHLESVYITEDGYNLHLGMVQQDQGYTVYPSLG